MQLTIELNFKSHEIDDFIEIKAEHFSEALGLENKKIINDYYSKGILFFRNIEFEPIDLDEIEDIFKLISDIELKTTEYISIDDDKLCLYSNILDNNMILPSFNMNPNTWTGYINLKFINLMQLQSDTVNTYNNISDFVNNTINIDELELILGDSMGVDEDFPRFKDEVDEYFNNIEMNNKQEKREVYTYNVNMSFNDGFDLIVKDIDGNERLIQFLNDVEDQLEEEV